MKVSPRPRSKPRRELAERLRARQAEIEAAVLSRVSALPDLEDVRDPEYSVGLRNAVRAAVTYGLIALEQGDRRQEPIPTELLSQASRAARAGIGLDTVLRRYVAGHALLGDFILREAAVLGGDVHAAWSEALHEESLLLDHLLGAVTDSYMEEIGSHERFTRGRRLTCVNKLLAGEIVNPEELGYELGSWHVGAVARGSGAARLLRGIVDDLACGLLLVDKARDEIWAWLGTGRRLASADVMSSAQARGALHAQLALGDPARGIEGWRLTHRQAVAAMPFAAREASGVVSYSDVALLAAVLCDEVLAESLRRTYLIPLEGEPDGGHRLRETLTAYLATGGNVSSAAAALGVSRQTLKKRLDAAEERIDQPLGRRRAELETALRLHAVQRAKLWCD
jgi:hypothetical protein